jgi:hypothetical protein
MSEKKSKSTDQPVGIKPNPAPSLNLSFPEKSKINPEGMDGLSLQDEVTVIVTGKVSSISAYSGEWGSRSLGLDIESCRIESGKDQAMGLGDAVEKTRRRL